MSVSIRFISVVFLIFLVTHVSLASPRQRGRGREVQEEAVGGVESTDLGLLPGEVDAIRNFMINLMDLLDDGGGITDQRNRRCRRRHCNSATTSDPEPTVIIVVEDENADPNELTLASFLYDDDTPWSRCTRSCVTRRARACKYHDLCGDEPLMEEAFCYAPGSLCESKVLDFLAEEGFIIVEDNQEEVLIDDTQSDPDYVPDYSLETDEEELYPDSEDNLFGDYYDYGWSEYLAGNNGDEHVQFEVEYDSEFDSHDYHDETGHDSQDNHGSEEEFHHEEVEDEVHEEQQQEQEEKQCGRKKVNIRDSFLRIIGGREARKGEWPWQAAILNRFKETFCGGTLIAPRWILTAAHCIRKRLYVRLAEHSLQDYDKQEVEMRVEQAFEHPDYDVETIEHDIALLKLPQEVVYNRYVNSACLPRRETPPPARSKCVVAGWGKERETHIFGSDVLNYARVPIVTKASCRKAYPDHPITSNHICAGFRRGASDTCSGDSGGPLVCQDEKGIWTVHGVTSFGEGCGDSGKYGVYTKVVNYLPWIRQIISQN